MVRKACNLDQANKTRIQLLNFDEFNQIGRSLLGFDTPDEELSNLQVYFPQNNLTVRKTSAVIPPLLSPLACHDPTKISEVVRKRKRMLSQGKLFFKNVLQLGLSYPKRQSSVKQVQNQHSQPSRQDSSSNISASKLSCVLSVFTRISISQLKLKPRVSQQRVIRSQNEEFEFQSNSSKLQISCLSSQQPTESLINLTQAPINLLQSDKPKQNKVKFDVQIYQGLGPKALEFLKLKEHVETEASIDKAQNFLKQMAESLRGPTRPITVKEEEIVEESLDSIIYQNYKRQGLQVEILVSESDSSSSFQSSEKSEFTIVSRYSCEKFQQASQKQFNIVPMMLNDSLWQQQKSKSTNFMTSKSYFNFTGKYPRPEEICLHLDRIQVIIQNRVKNRQIEKNQQNSTKRLSQKSSFVLNSGVKSPPKRSPVKILFDPNKSVEKFKQNRAAMQQLTTQRLVDMSFGGYLRSTSDNVLEE